MRYERPVHGDGLGGRAALIPQVLVLWRGEVVESLGGVDQPALLHGNI